MNSIVLRATLAVAMSGAVAAAAAAPVLTEVSLLEAASTASTLETRHLEGGRER
ncbi:hypothetical protein [Stenotrophomonas maltophilia]|uniref:hypothetical protein n=1 Tax=Stenotrophomonas maltophilia TaxID=40324 RepID=UPI0039F6801D